MNKLKVVIFFCLFVFLVDGNCQIPRLRVGLKIGVPNIIGANIEVLPKTPRNRFAITSDFSILNSYYTLQNYDLVQFIYGTIGAKYYLLKESKGLYGGFSFGNVWVNTTQKHGVIKDSANNVIHSNVSLYMNSYTFLIHPNLGYRFAWKKFSLMPEIGYSINLFTKIKTYLESESDGYNEKVEEKIDPLIPNTISLTLTIGILI